MASERMHELINAIASDAEWQTRPHVANTPSRMEAALLYAKGVREVWAYAQNHTDRQVAAAYPTLIERWMPRGWWDKVKPKEATDGK